MNLKIIVLPAAFLFAFALAMVALADTPPNGAAEKSATAVDKKKPPEGKAADDGKKDGDEKKDTDERKDGEKHHKTKHHPKKES
jgi:hypothetical protein